MSKEAIAKAPQRRARRTTIGTRNVLSVIGQDPNYAYRIVNDTGDRVLRLQDQDWEMVEAKDVQVGDRRVGNPASTNSYAEVSVGGGMKAYVMRKRKDWHEEDQAAKQEYVKKTEAATQEQASDGAFYGKVEINRS